MRDRSFPALNAVRAAGALMVLSTHSAFDTGRILQGWTGAVLARMDFGVTLFFVLSGFLLSRPYFLRALQEQPAPSVRHYLWKRALRILPLYWVVVLVALVFDPANSAVQASDWATHLTLTQLYRPGLLASGLTQMWSLCTEVAFYLLLPPLVAWLVRRGRRSHLTPRAVLVKLAIIAALGVAWQTRAATIPGVEGHYAQWLPGYLPWFAAGMAFAVISASLAVHPRDHLLERLGADTGGSWIIATAVFAIASTPIAGPRTLDQPTGWDAFFKCVLYGVSASFFVLPLVFGPERRGLLRSICVSRVPYFLGDISFGIFCIHVLVMHAVFRNFHIEVFTGRFPTVVLTTAAISIVLATASHYWLERPFMRLRNKGPFAGRPRKAQQTAVTTSS